MKNQVYIIQKWTINLQKIQDKPRISQSAQITWAQSSESLEPDALVCEQMVGSGFSMIIDQQMRKSAFVCLEASIRYLISHLRQICELSILPLLRLRFRDSARAVTSARTISYCHQCCKISIRFAFYFTIQAQYIMRSRLSIQEGLFILFVSIMSLSFSCASMRCR